MSFDTLGIQIAFSMMIMMMMIFNLLFILDADFVIVTDVVIVVVYDGPFADVVFVVVIVVVVVVVALDLFYSRCSLFVVDNDTAVICMPLHFCLGY